MKGRRTFFCNSPKSFCNVLTSVESDTDPFFFCHPPGGATPPPPPSPPRPALRSSISLVLAARAVSSSATLRSSRRLWRVSFCLILQESREGRGGDEEKRKRRKGQHDGSKDTRRERKAYSARSSFVYPPPSFFPIVANRKEGRRSGERKGS
jgi:hypothetical protein